MGLAERDYMKRPSGDAARQGSMQMRGKWQISGLVLLLMILLAFAAKLPGGLLSGHSELVFPPNGTVAYVGGKAPNAETARFFVSDDSRSGLNKVIRFRAPDGATLAAELYLQPGKNGEVQLRPGVYRLHISEGRRWLGPAIHFGDQSSTHDLGTHAIGGAMAGLTILPSSPVGNAAPIAGSRF